jgi:PAS domain S-box-containing protein
MVNLKIRFILFITGFIPLTIFAQVEGSEVRVIDSLKRIYHANQRIKASQNLLLKNIYDLAGYYRISNADSAIRYYEKSLRLAEEINVDTIVSLSLENLGNLYLQKGMPYTALEHFIRNYEFWEHKGDQGAMAFTLCDIGNVYYSNSLYEVAKNYYLQSLHLFQKLNHKLGLSVIYNNLGMIKGVEKDYDSAIYFFNQAIRLRQQINDQFAVLHSRIYVAETYLKQNKPEMAITLLDEILYLMNNITLPYGEEDEYRISTYILRGNTWQVMKKYGPARENYQAALKLANRINSGYYQAEVYFNIAKLAYEENKFSEALKTAELASGLAKRFDNIGIYRNSLNLLARLNEKVNRHDLSSFYYKKSFFYTDSLLKEAITGKLKDVAKAIELYNLKVQNEKSEERHRRQQILWISIASILFLVLLSIAAYLRVLARSRKEFENIANASFEGIIIHDKGTIIHFNRKAEELFGRKASDMKGKAVYDFFTPEHREFVRDLGQSDQEANYRAEIEKPDGSHIEVEVLSKPFYYKNRKFRVAAIRDITRLQKLIRDNLILWTAVEQMPDMFLFTDKNGNVIYANSAFEKITGYKRHEVQGQNPRLVKSGVHNADFYKSMWKTLESGKVWSGEFLNRKKDGSLFWTRAIISPVKDERGEIIYYASVSEDITEQRKVAEEMRRKDLLYRQMASNLPDTAVFLINRELKFELAEGRALTEIGLKSPDFVDENVNVVLSNNQAHLEEFLLKVFEGQFIAYLTRFGEKDFQVILTPLTDTDGNIILALMLMKDITESMQREKLLIENERKLNELLETKNRFISILAHDLRNPFSSILGFCELLQDNYFDFDDSKKIEFIGHIRHSAENTLNLINSLLNWSQLQQNQVHVKHVYVLASEVLKEAIESTEYMAKQKGIILKQQVEADTTLLTDPDVLSTILRNLITNAIKYSYPGSEVVVRGCLPVNGKCYEIKVIDHGVGIPKEAISGLFNLSNSRSTEGTAREKGSGMGLVLVKEMVEKLGSLVLVESVVGQGTTFTVRLPLES